MNKKLSIKLRILSFNLMVLIVFLHSYNLDYGSQIVYHDFFYNLNYFIQNFISQGIARIAVPIFFAVSGFLFFISFDFTTKGYLLKIKKRINSLVVPYVLWSIISVLFFGFLFFFPFSKTFVLSKINNFNIINLILVNPIPFQLWFLRDLFILVLISPLIYFLTKKTKGYWLLFLLFMWMFNYNIIFLRSYESIMFFGIGSFISLVYPKIVEVKFQKKHILLSIFIWFIFITISIVLNYFSKTPIINNIIYKIGILIGFISFWFLTDFFLFDKLILKYKKIYKFSFFLFCSHEPLLTSIRKFLLIISGVSNLSLILVYFFSALLTILLSILFGIYLKNNYKNIFSILSGNR